MLCSSNTKRNLLLLFLLLCVAAFPLWSQEAIEAQQDTTIYTIRDVDYTIEGKTRKSVLVHYLEIEAGENFKGRRALEEYLAEKLQLIKNQRTLADGAITTSYEPDSENPSVVYVDLKVKVSDTWNYLLLPYGKYDSNEGLLISLRGRNYNFFGGMEELAINLDYLKPSIEESEYSLNSSFAVPFYMYGYKWKFDFSEDVILSSEEPTYFNAKAGLSMDIPMVQHTWQASVNQEYNLNEDGEEDPDGWYLNSSGSFGSSIPLAYELPGFGEVDYSLALITSIAYKPGHTLSVDRRGYELGGTHGISTGRIDWYGNFRDGTTLELSQNLRWNFQRERWLSDFNTELQVHKEFGFMGFSSRIQGFYRYGGEMENAGSDLRGILNNRFDAKSGIFANVDFPIKMWVWFLDKWFEGQVSPFFDYGLVRQPGGSFDISEAWYGVGIEGFAFAKFARSVYLRMSLGLDLEALLDGASLGDPAPRDGSSVYEVYIGLGHHY